MYRRSAHESTVRPTDLPADSKRLSRTPRSSWSARRLAAAHLSAVPAFAALAVMILWVAHDGGYDEDTWYWGALVLLGLLAVSVITCGTGAVRRRRSLRLALLAFALYVGWSYLSIAWAGSPGDALTGSN